MTYDPASSTWAELGAEGACFAAEDFRGKRPLVAGKVTSLALPGVTFDLAEFWRDCGFEDPASV